MIENTMYIIFYRPQTKFAKVMFLQVSVCPHGGCAWLIQGGMCGCSEGVCVVTLGACMVALRGGAWGACVVALVGMCGCSEGGGMYGCSGGHVWLPWGGACVVAAGGACVVAPGGGGKHGIR